MPDEDDELLLADCQIAFVQRAEGSRATVCVVDWDFGCLGQRLARGAVVRQISIIDWVVELRKVRVQIERS